MTTTIDPFYITTAIPYVNAAPHVGFALEALLADVLARWRRLRGDDVRLQSGTDDHSLKNVRAAAREGVPTPVLVERYAGRFAALAPALQLGYDDFIRTSVEPRHRAGVERLWRACADAGDLYRRHYRGLYCTGCECFYREAELPGGLCPEHGTRPELVDEDNWFFRLSRHRDRLLDLVHSGRLHITPASRRNEVLALLAAGLEDFSVSRVAARARGWGIPVPGDPGQVIYVWFDALANYISALGWAADAPDYRRWWAGGGRRVHVIGKGILRFHALYWPAILLSAGLPLPTDLLVHGYLTAEGNKISKSSGADISALDPALLVLRHGSEAVRHFLLRHLRPFEDGDFSEVRLQAARDAELANQLGNLLRRTIVLAGGDGVARWPLPGPSQPDDQPLRRLAEALPARLDDRLGAFATDEALAAVFELVAETNRYLDRTAPWKLPREPRRATIVHHALEALRVIGVALAPFLPGTSAAIAGQLGQPAAEQLGWTGLRWGGGRPPAGTLPGGPPLFPRAVPAAG